MYLRIKRRHVQRRLRQPRLATVVPVAAAGVCSAVNQASGVDTGMHYDSNNIFARILREELPCHKVYEDEHALAFMDIMPQADGHTLVIPKAAAVTLFDLPAEQLGALMIATQTVAAAVKKAFSAPGIVLFQLNGAEAGQTVPHLHFHILPSALSSLMNRAHAAQMEDNQKLADFAARVRAELP